MNSENFSRNRSDENKRKYSNQQNYCVSLLTHFTPKLPSYRNHLIDLRANQLTGFHMMATLVFNELRKTKKNYYSNLSEKKITDNKTFWETVKPFLSDKTPSNEKITLIEKDKIIKTDTKTVNVLNTFFSTIINNLNIPEYPMFDAISNNVNDPILKSILKYKDHPSIKAIEKISKLNSLFKFSNMAKTEILNEIVNLDASKSCQDRDVPTKIIKENADIFPDFIHPAINASINKKEFPSFLKLVDVIPVFKKG